MLDPIARRLIDPPLNWCAPYIKATPTQITLIGFGFGVASFICILQNYFIFGLILLFLNRLCDGLDGAVARAHDQTTDLGAYIDIVADFLLWALLPVAFAYHNPENAMAAAVLLSSFAMSMTTFLAFAILAEKRQLTSTAQGKKSFFYLAGLAEGSETILFFAACFIWPDLFVPFALAFAALVYLSSLGRIMSSWQELRK
jgi:phosphatidylglycerophosphate synthase